MLVAVHNFLSANCMPLNLKRKGYEITTSRKVLLNYNLNKEMPDSEFQVRKSEEQEPFEGSDQDANNGMNDSTSLHGDSDLDEVEGEEWTGTGLNVPPPNQKGADNPIEPPTGEELRVIKVAADLFKSSSFKLQVRPPSLDVHFSLNTILRLMYCCRMFVLNPPEYRLSNGFSFHYTLLSRKYHHYNNNIPSRHHARCSQKALPFHISYHYQRRRPTGKSATKVRVIFSLLEVGRTK